MQRRILLQAAVATTQMSLLVGGSILPKRLLAAWPAGAFESDSMTEIQRLSYGEREIQDSDNIQIEAPDIAENGRNVPVDIQFQFAEVSSVTLLSDTNPYPLLSQAHFTGQVAPRLSLRVKLGGSGKLIAIVDADGKLYRATRPVKVTAGGCGG